MLHETRFAARTQHLELRRALLSKQSKNLLGVDKKQPAGDKVREATRDEDPTIEAEAISTREIRLGPLSTPLVARDEGSRHERNQTALPRRWLDAIQSWSSIGIQR